jgi:DNA-binding NtrC family response regulator
LPDADGNYGVLIIASRSAGPWPARDTDDSMVQSDSFLVSGSAGQGPALRRRFPATAELHRQLAEMRRTAASIYRLDRLVGVSDALRHVRRQVAAAIASGANTTILGPSRNANEQIARTIHYSQYAAGKAPPLIPLDGATCDAETVQSALRHLHNERTNGQHGRLLLARVELMQSAAQRELSEFVRLPTFDLGLLATAARSPSELAKRDEFDAILAQHLATIEIRLPPLRERLEDIPISAQAIVEDFNAEGNQQLAGLTPDALEMLYRYPWPDDVDELERVVYEACQSAKGTHVTSLDLPTWLAQAIDVHEQRRPLPHAIDLAAFLQDVENELMRRALQAAKGNKTQAARLLGISRQRMIRWAENHGPPETGQGTTPIESDG